MENKTTKIVLIDNNDNTRKDLVEQLKTKDNFDVCADFNGAEQALRYILNNEVDVVITDLVLPNIDGYTFLEKLKQMNLPHTPKVIVISALSADTLVQRAFELGADYYMVKPTNSEVLTKRINELSVSKVVVKETKPVRNKALEEKITNIFITVGIPAHIKGYQFLREAIKMAIDNPEIINSITKKLYPSIAERFDTSASKVERAIRHAIEVAWNRGKIENINTLFGIRVYSNNEKPTNGEFIALVADKMLIEGA